MERQERKIQEKLLEEKLKKERQQEKERKRAQPTTTAEGGNEASFTRTDNVTVLVNGTFNLFDRHFDGQNKCGAPFARQSVCHWLNIDKVLY